MDSKLLVGFLCMAAGLLGLFWLGYEVLEGDTFALDKAILRTLRTAHDDAMPIGPHWLLQSLTDITALGGFTVLTLLTSLVVGFLLASRKPGTALFVALAIASGAVLSTILKDLFVRQRPEIVPHLVQVSSTSFPSSHAMNSAMVYLTLAALLARSQEETRVRLYLISAAIALTAIVGISRVYLGVHWPSDVLAGWTFGAIWAASCSFAAKALQRLRRMEPPGTA
ncbi:phosphatase PAP2 family protein [Novosphingobium cyanobacteriorum]|nr:phosphatase PAP2 family protein [Novosphingobium cyanobacteriorum]